MWSLEVLDCVNREAAKDARRNAKKPIVLSLVEEVDFDEIQFPWLGPYVPAGWKRRPRPEWFVDVSGHGEEGDPALTISQFHTALSSFVREYPGFGYAVVERGPFQAYIGVYEPVDNGIRPEDN